MLRNTPDGWGWPSIATHWIAAAAILVLLAHGWWMTHMLARPERLANYAWHAALGYDLFALVVLRMLWRWINPVPQLPPGTRRWERVAAQLGHAGLYILMFAVSITGWIVATTSRVPKSKDLFGLQWPVLVADVTRPTRKLLEESHLVLAYLLAAVVLVHILGALRHHVLKKNDVLRRMLRAETPVPDRVDR
ncbi:MAG: cytochrome b [Proteobacteria bacterium]|nr:cytochrome b [Pseudomonadota bacterium]